MQKMSAREVRLGLTTSALVLVLGFFVLEGFVRVTRPRIDLYVVTGRTPGENPISQWALVDAFSAFRGKPGRYSEGKTVNRDGFMSTPETPLTKPPRTLRIAFLGESSTAGMGKDLRDEQTWPWETVQMLKTRTGRSLDFINGALGGYTSFESYGRLWSRIRFFQPDIVVLCHGWNELTYFNSRCHMDSWRSLSDGSWSLSTMDQAVETYAPRRIDPFLRWSQILTRLRLRLALPDNGEIGPGAQAPLAKAYDPRGPEIWRTQLRLFRETCRVLNIKLFVVKQPTLITAGLPAAERKKCRCYLHGFDYNSHLAAFRDLYKVIDEEIPSNSVIDLTSLSGNPAYFFDHIHPTPEGARAMASLISTRLADDFQP